VGDNKASSGALTDLSPSVYQHPADRAATDALARVPGLDDLVRRLMAMHMERRVQADLLGSGIRLGPRQLPEIWALHRHAFETLGFEDVPSLYLTASPVANAWTYGSTKPIVALNSYLVDLMDDQALLAVMAHEAGHVHCEHTLYNTVLAYLLGAADLAVMGSVAAVPLAVVRLALTEWSRAAELSCDRVAALVTRDPDAVCMTLMTLAGGTSARRLDLEAFIEQGLEYDAGTTGVEGFRRRFRHASSTHPLPIRRVRALMDWVQSGDYERILRGDYVRRSEDGDFAQQATAAARRYATGLEELAESTGKPLDEATRELDEMLSAQTDP
jgi:Zn-dependent protease with chaperone function